MENAVKDFTIDLKSLPEIQLTLTQDQQKLRKSIDDRKSQLPKILPIDKSSISEPIQKALNYVRKAARKRNFNAQDIQSIHSLLELDEQGGQFRQESFKGETVEINRYLPPEAKYIEHLMEEFVARYACINQAIDPLEEICAAYFLFEYLHPFPDGNGRTGRLICSWLMFQNGYEFLTPHLEKRWGEKNPEHAAAFQAESSNCTFLLREPIEPNDWLHFLGEPNERNKRFSKFYLYFLQEILSLIDQI